MYVNQNSVQVAVSAIIFSEFLEYVHKYIFGMNKHALVKKSDCLYDDQICRQSVGSGRSLKGVQHCRKRANADNFQVPELKD